MGFKQTHPKHHRLKRIFDRKDQKLFPLNIQIGLKAYQDSRLKPYSEIVDDFDSHCQGLANQGEVLIVSRMSANLKEFLGRVIQETNEFAETTKLLTAVRNYQEANNLKTITMCSYLGKLKKFFDFIELHASERFQHFKNHPWEKILQEVRVRVQVGSQKEKKKKRKLLQNKVPSLNEVQRVNEMVTEFLNKDLGERKMKYKELSAMNFMILSFRYRVSCLNV